MDDSGTGVSPRGRVASSGLEGRNVVIEEKLDGSEVSIEFDDGLDAVARFRGSPLDLSGRGGAERSFDRLKDIVAAREAELLEVLENRYRLYAEWMYAAHRAFYDRLPSYLMEFDVFDKAEGRFLDTPRRASLLAPLGAWIRPVPVLFSGGFEPRGFVFRDRIGRSVFRSPEWRSAAEAEALKAGLNPDDFLSRLDPTDLAEGFYGKVEEAGSVVARFKWVRPDFIDGIVRGAVHWRSLPLVPNRCSD